MRIQLLIHYTLDQLLIQYTLDFNIPIFVIILTVNSTKKGMRCSPTYHVPWNTKSFSKTNGTLSYQESDIFSFYVCCCKVFYKIFCFQYVMKLIYIINNSMKKCHISDFRPSPKQLTNKRIVTQNREAKKKTELKIKKIIIVYTHSVNLNSTESIFAAKRSLPKCNALKHCLGDNNTKKSTFQHF